MTGTFSPPMEALTVAAVTVDLMIERQSRLAFMFAREIAMFKPPSSSGASSETVMLARELISGLIRLVRDGSLSPALSDRLVSLLDRLGRDEAKHAFRSVCYLEFGGCARPMVISAWCDILVACCGLSRSG